MSLKAQSQDEFQRNFVPVVDIFNDIWIDTPDSISTRIINQGVNALATYNFPIGESNISFSAGAGISVHNTYMDALPLLDTSGATYLQSFKSLYPSLDYKRIKITTAFLDFPFEFRLKTKSDFKVALGFKGGLNISSHLKYKGDNYMAGTDSEMKIKFDDVANIENYHAGFTMRLGWKWINIYGYYSMSKLFKDGEGPEMYPISLGISFMTY